jgi:hypothetical protein
MDALSMLSLMLTLTAPASALSAPSLNQTWAGVSFMPGPSPELTAVPHSWPIDFRPSDAIQGGPPPQVAFEYSDGYKKRLRVHRDASYAMLPLFAAEAVVGEKLFKNPNAQGLRTAHGWLNVGILGLFGVDTITGVWNLKEGWHDPQGRARRLIHSLLMLTADVGFVATDRLAPSRRAVAAGNTSGAVTHRDVAVVSISAATVGYLIMVFR